MDKSSLKWNNLCGVLRHMPCLLEIYFFCKIFQWNSSFPSRNTVNSSNHSRVQRHNLECKVATNSQKTSYFGPQKKTLGELKTYLAVEMSQNNTLTHGKQ